MNYPKPEVCDNIIQLYTETDMTEEDIADYLNIEVSVVSEFINDYTLNPIDDSMDGDFDTGMASAGYGTDEDYGYYGEEF